MAKYLKCRTCGAPFAPRYAGQKQGNCPGCNAERRRLRALHVRRNGDGRTDGDEEMLRRLEAISCRAPRL